MAAISGGADSIALLDALTRLSVDLNLKIHVVHVDHGLRGRSSRADARFVERLAAKHGLSCSVERLDLPDAPARGKRDASLESEWRDARYRVLVRHAKRRRAACIALGHHRDDLAETVLMRMIRGAGALGLGAFGPEAKRDGVRLVRPLYETSREEIEEYCHQRGLKWREDASNRDRRRLRNQVRQDLIPLLEHDFNPSIRDALARAADTLREDDALLEQLADHEWRWINGDKRGVPREMPLSTLRALPLATLRRLLRRWLSVVASSQYPPSFSEVACLAELIHEKNTGARFELRRRWAFIRERDRISVRAIRRASTGKKKR